MYITTEENGIINSDNYPRIDIYPNADTYVLGAFTERDPNQSEPKQRITIAVYSKKIDADYALIHLYRSIDMEKNTWNSKDAPLFSDIWNTLKQKLSNDPHVLDNYEIENVSFDITLPDQLSITIPYAVANKYIDDNKLPDEEIDFIKSNATIIYTELVNLLKKNPIIPIKTINFTLKLKKLSET